MKHQQVVVDYWQMVKISISCLLLAFAGYILLKMIQAVFWLPGHLNRNQIRLEELAKKLSDDLDNHDIVNNDNNEQNDIISEKEEIVDNKKDK